MVHFSRGTIIFINLKKHIVPQVSRLLHKICARANFGLVMGCFNEVIWGSNTVRGDKDSISWPSGINLHTATYHSATTTLANIEATSTHSPWYRFV